MKAFFAALVLLVGMQTAAAFADTPSYSSPDGDQQIRGRIVSINGYNVSVRDEQGYTDNVELHDGTIINPTGLTLEPGMVVDVLGYNAGSYYAANEIDTPYNFYGGEPYYLGHPWTYYGPSIGLGFFFGAGATWYHPDVFHGHYHFAPHSGGRIYPYAHVGPIYQAHGGAFHGHNVVAPHAMGGFHGGGGHGGGGHGGGGHGHGA